jgi:hypothetical protein
MGTAKILTRSIRMETDPPVLLVAIEIDCESCGEYTIVVLGHHVQALIQALTEVAEHEPALTAPGEIEVVSRRFQHHTPGLN